MDIFFSANGQLVECRKWQEDVKRRASTRTSNPERGASGDRRALAPANNSVFCTAAQMPPKRSLYTLYKASLGPDAERNVCIPLPFSLSTDLPNRSSSRLLVAETGRTGAAGA